MFNKNSLRNKKYGNAFLALVIIVFIIVTTIGSIFIISIPNPAAVYNTIAFVIVMIWLCIFTTYFLWALRFYNINFGITEEEWDRIDKAKHNRREGLVYNENDILEEPVENPYRNETFGLPGGTVRGMIAFTLLFGAIAILVASLAPNNSLGANSLLVDQYDFFKTAFLMMIAFYFGARSLEFLKGKNPPTIAPQNQTQTSDVEMASTTDNNSSENANQQPPNIKVSVQGNVTTIPMISHIKDPMSH